MQWIIITKVTTEDNPGWVTEEDWGRTFVATTARSVHIIPETAYFQSGQERNKNLRYSRKLSRGYSGRWWRRTTGSWRIFQQRRRRTNNPFPQVSMLFTVKTWNQGKIIWYFKSKHYSVKWITGVPRKGRHLCILQSETKKNVWVSIDRYGKSSPAIVSWDFWESIGGKSNSPRDHWVETTDGQSEGLQVVGVGEPWPVYLERMEKCYILEPLVIRGLSHSDGDVLPTAV